MSSPREGFSVGRFLIRWAVNAVALWVAFKIVPGIHVEKLTLEAIIIIAAVFGLVNAIIRPIIAFLTCPLIILTLGLGTLLINAAMFWLAGQLSNLFGFGFVVDGFWPALLGALVVSIVSVILSAVLGGRRRVAEDD